MNKLKAIFANRKFSLDGLIEIVCTILGFVGLIVVFAVLYWLFDTYPAETGAGITGIVILALVGWILVGIVDTIFPKQDDPEVDKWIERAKMELDKIRAGEKDESD